MYSHVAEGEVRCILQRFVHCNVALWPLIYFTTVSHISRWSYRKCWLTPPDPSSGDMTSARGPPNMDCSAAFENVGHVCAIIQANRKGHVEIPRLELINQDDVFPDQVSPPSVSVTAARLQTVPRRMP